ncbi:MAG: recombinase family protein [Chloroflexi bacterium]|nr:recombinase family protein [Chloroflexota bacterium]
MLRDDAEAETLLLVYRLYLDGHPNSAIVAHLEREGRPTRYGRPWNAGTLARLITNADSYLGELRTTMAGETFTHGVEPLIDRVTVKLLQDRRAENTSHRGPRAAGPTDHLLRTLLTCTCDRTWQSKRDPRTGRLYYRCPNSKAERTADCGRSVGDRVVREHVWSIIFDNLIAEDAGHMFVRFTGNQLEANRDEIEAEVAEAERLLRQFDKERLNLDRQLVKGAISETNHARLTSELDGELVILTAQLADPQERQSAAVDVEAYEEQAGGFVYRAMELSVTPEGRQTLCRALIENVLVTRG